MNKQQIEEAEKWLYDFRNKVEYTFPEIMVMYVEYKREEMERKAYEAGLTFSLLFANEVCRFIPDDESLEDFNMPKIKTYDQWKESQNQEQ